MLSNLGSVSTVPDRYNKIPAQATNIISQKSSPEGVYKSYAFTEGSKVEVPKKSVFSLAEEVGFTLNLLPTLKDATIVDYLDNNQQLKMHANKLVYSVETDKGKYSISSDEIVTSNWLRVSAHFTNDKLILQIDDRVYATAVEGRLKMSIGNLASIVIGGDFTGNISNFRVFDWLSPKLSVFENGLDKIEVDFHKASSVDLEIFSTGQLNVVRDSVAVKLALEMDPTWGSHVAYADFQTDFFDVVTRVWETPVTVNIPEAIIPDFITDGDISFDVSTEKVIMPIVDTAMYIQAVEQDMAIGFLLGTPTDTWGGTTGDIVSSAIMYGDLRDTAKQWYFQATDNPAYNNTEHILAQIGILTNLIEVGGFLVGGVPGVIVAAIDLVAGGAKVASKTYRTSSGLIRHLGPVLSKLYDGLKNRGEWLPLKYVVPFLEAFIAVSLMSDEIKQFFEDAFSSEEDVDVWVDYTISYKTNFEETTAYNEVSGVKIAYAAVSWIKQFTGQLEKTVSFANKNGIKRSVGSTTDAVVKPGAMFTRALTVLNKCCIGKEFTYAEETMNAMMIAGHYGPKATLKVDGKIVPNKDAMSNLATSGSKGPLKTNLARDSLINTINEIDWVKLFDGLSPTQTKELKEVLASNNGPFGYLGKGPSAAKAAKMMFEQIAYIQKFRPDLKVISLEKRIKVLDAKDNPVFSVNGNALHREIDMVLKTVDDAGNVTYVELKGWGKTVTLNNGRIIGAGQWMANQYAKQDSQIFKDVLIFATKQKEYNIAKFSGVQWQLHKEAVDSLGGIAKMKQDLIKKVDGNKDWFMPHLGIDNMADWKVFRNKLKVAINNKEFFKVVD